MALTTGDLQQAPVIAHFQLPGDISVFEVEFKKDKTSLLSFLTINQTNGVKKTTLCNNNCLWLTGTAWPS